jgi:hypothetical protein
MVAVMAKSRSLNSDALAVSDVDEDELEEGALGVSDASIAESVFLSIRFGCIMFESTGAAESRIVFDFSRFSETSLPRNAAIFRISPGGVIWSASPAAKNTGTSKPAQTSFPGSPP